MPGNDRNRSKYRKKFEGLAKVPSTALPGPMKEYCEEIADRVRQLAPVDEGELRDSVVVERPWNHGERHLWQVAVLSDHAAAVEYGTHVMTARPYFRPAISERRATLKTFVTSGLDRGVKKVGR